jgi:hypothetical protein
MRAHEESVQRASEAPIELVVDLMEHVEVQRTAPDHRLVGDHEEAISGVAEEPGRRGCTRLHLEVVEVPNRVGSVDVEHSVTIEENYTVANLKHNVNAVERMS